MSSTPSKTDRKAGSLPDWLASPVGQYLCAWEQAYLDQAVVDVFGFHALQLGLPTLDALRANRMPHRWLAESALSPQQATTQDAPVQAQAQQQPTQPDSRQRLLTQYEALPFPDASLDLLVLPHTLEFSHDPHATLREVQRVLVPEGRVVICGFNPNSLWGLSPGFARRIPEVGGFIGASRLRDWLRLLSFEVQTSHFGCYRPAVHTAAWLQRWAWLDKAGPRWWPILGNVYALTAVKRVHGMRLLTPARKRAVPRAAVVATPRMGAADTSRTVSSDTTPMSSRQQGLQACAASPLLKE